MSYSDAGKNQYKSGMRSKAIRDENSCMCLSLTVVNRSGVNLAAYSYYRLYWIYARTITYST